MRTRDGSSSAAETVGAASISSRCSRLSRADGERAVVTAVGMVVVDARVNEFRERHEGVGPQIASPRRMECEAESLRQELMDSSEVLDITLDHI
ncbi:hypothetical protein [Nocardia nepalensis]|uniref:hypothetical protein n=1 Tax=Nocardia nepalensis TaxID=3375448 RepID=UPI003B66D775